MFWVVFCLLNVATAPRAAGELGNLDLSVVARESVFVVMKGLVAKALSHGSQHLIEWGGSETGGVISQTIGNNQLAVVEESTTGVNDVGHVAFTLVLVGFEQGFAEAADHSGGIIAIEEERTDAVLSQGADTVTKHQPACVGLNGRPAVAKLDQFPRECWFQYHLALMP